MSELPGHHSLWVLIKPAEDVAHTWEAHCLTLDVVSCGGSPQHALHMITEAVAMVLADDLAAGRDPLQFRRRAPPQYWEELHGILTEGQILYVRTTTEALDTVASEGYTLAIPLIWEGPPRQIPLADQPLSLPLPDCAWAGPQAPIAACG